jgi:hypothetical protein
VPTLIAHEPLKEEPIDILKDPTPSGHKSKHEREMARAAREDEAVVVAPKDSFTGRPWDDYNIARGMEQSAGEAWFFSHYPNHLSLSCLNLEQARNQHVALRFECSNRGVFLAIRHSETYLVFPHLSDNFLSARKSLEGVFSYPDSTSGSLKLKRPARVIEGQRGEFTLTDAGVINHG